MLRIGLIGLDTSHAPAFTHLLNDPSHPHHVPGSKVVAAFPGGSPDMDISRNRVQKFTDQLKTQFQIPILDSPESVAEACDLLFILSVDGRTHLDLFQRTLKFRRPTFIDKPLATTSTDAAEIFRLANTHNIPLMSCSSLRFADPLVAQLADPTPILAVDIFGPLTILPEPPGLFFYGIHSLEILIATLGPNPTLANLTATPTAEILTFTYPDHRTATIHLLKTGAGAHHDFGITLHREKSVHHLNLSTSPRPNYAPMLESILHHLPTGKSPIPQLETLNIIHLLEQANQLRTMS